LQIRPSHNALRIGRYLFAAAVVIAIAVALIKEWGALQTALAAARPRWGYIVLSCLVVLANYAMLIEAWRTVLVGWTGKGRTGFTISFWEGARIWSISNLGRYIPGKVWQMGTMAVMAQARGVSGIAAAGSAVIITLLTTVGGFVVLAITGADVLRLPPFAIVAVVAVGVGVLLSPQLLPWLGALAGRILRRDIAIPRLPHRAIWLAGLISAISWVVYGIAFRLLVIGVLGNAPGALSYYVAVFTGPYLVGFLVLFMPGGIGVREMTMLPALQQAGFDTGEAILIVVASRVWLTILEVIPAVLFLAHRWVRPRRPDDSLQITPH
jgi:uncharacterized membrane protein YbhN (UPF0104 family)